MSQVYFVRFFKGQRNNIPPFFIPCGGLLEVIFTELGSLPDFTGTSFTSQNLVKKLSS